MRPIGLCVIGLLTATACALAAVGGGRPPLFRRDPGGPIPPQKLPPGIKSLSAEACRQCHEEIYNQGKTSRHSKAATGDIWRTCWTNRNQPPFCTNCHFPLAQQKPRVLAGFKESGPLPRVLLDKPNFNSALTREGVNCAVCHIRSGTILGPRQFTPKEMEDIPHPVQYDERFTKSEFCYGCHGWSFPRARMSEGLCDGVHSYTKFEWDKKQTCQSCHLPRRKGPVTEDYPEREYGAHVEGHLARTPEGLRESLPMEVKLDKERYAAGETVNATVTVTNKAGHTAPTAGGRFTSSCRWWTDRATRQRQKPCASAAVLSSPPTRRNRTTRASPPARPAPCATAGASRRGGQGARCNCGRNLSTTSSPRARRKKPRCRRSGRRFLSL